jgi:hypothetical protein
MCWYYSKVPGQEFVDAVDRMIGDALQDMAQIEFRIKSVKLGSSCRAPDYAEWQAPFLWRVRRCRPVARG